MSCGTYSNFFQHLRAEVLAEGVQKRVLARDVANANGSM